MRQSEECRFSDALNQLNSTRSDHEIEARFEPSLLTLDQLGATGDLDEGPQVDAAAQRDRGAFRPPAPGKMSKISRNPVDGGSLPE